MKRLHKEAKASKIIVFGLLSHHAYSILLFLSSQLRKDLGLPISIFYILVASLPSITLCLLAVVKDRDPERGVFGNKDMKIVRDGLLRSQKP